MSCVIIVKSEKLAINGEIKRLLCRIWHDLTHMPPEHIVCWGGVSKILCWLLQFPFSPRVYIRRSDSLHGKMQVYFWVSVSGFSLFFPCGLNSVRHILAYKQHKFAVGVSAMLSRSSLSLTLEGSLLQPVCCLHFLFPLMDNPLHPSSWGFVTVFGGFLIQSFLLFILFFLNEVTLVKKERKKNLIINN